MALHDLPDTEGQLGDASFRLSLQALSSPKFQKAIASYTILDTSFKWAKRQYQQYQNKHSYQVLVPGGTDLYRAAEAWLITQVPSSDQRSLSALVIHTGTHTRSEELLERVTGKPRKRRRAANEMVIAFDGSVEQKVVVDGHTVKVSTFEDSPHGVSVDAGSVQTFKSNLRTMKFVCQTEEARYAVLEMLKQELSKQEEEGIRCFVLDQWGDWKRKDFMAQRPMSTVFMAQGVTEGLRQDLELFLASEADYLRLGMPWHRGYLLHGDPGTGKTSLARALAYEYDLDIYMMSLPDIEKDTNLTSSFAYINAPALLLIEDIDVATAATSREEHQSTVSLSGLLNALDGVGTPHGLITVMTSNHPEKLDPALVRSGRVDQSVLCEHLDDETFQRLVKGTVGLTPNFSLQKSVPAADVMEVIKRHVHDKPEEIVYHLESEYGQQSVTT